MNDDELLSSVVADVRIAATAFATSPEAAVAHCPGWPVADLVGRHGAVLRWAEAIVRTGEPVVEPFLPPEGHHERGAWYVDAANEFVATLSLTNRDRECWTFGHPPGSVWFWTRRQAVEAAVHRWDAELASGATVGIRTDLCCLGITEVVEHLFPRQVALGRTADLSCGVELRATDVDQRWMLSSRPGATGAVAEAPASVLFLLLWQRVTLDDQRIRFTGSDLVRGEMRGAQFAP